jgi:hypothetical protein
LLNGEKFAAPALFCWRRAQRTFQPERADRKRQASGVEKVGSAWPRAAALMAVEFQGLGGILRRFREAGR